MEEKIPIRFSTTVPLLVTGLCFFSFTLLLRILDGVTVTLLLVIGLATFFSGLLIEALIAIGRKSGHATKTPMRKKH